MRSASLDWVACPSSEFFGELRLFHNAGSGSVSVVKPCKGLQAFILWYYFGYTVLTLEIHAVAAFEIKDLTGFVGGCDSGPKVLNNAADFRDLLGVAFGKLSAADEQAVF